MNASTVVASKILTASRFLISKQSRTVVDLQRKPTEEISGTWTGLRWRREDDGINLPAHCGCPDRVAMTTVLDNALVGWGTSIPSSFARGPYSTFRVKIIVTSDEPAEAVAGVLLEWVGLKLAALARTGRPHRLFAPIVPPTAPGEHFIRITLVAEPAQDLA